MAEKGKQINRIILRNVANLSKELEAEGLLLHAEFLTDIEEIFEYFDNEKLILVYRGESPEEISNQLSKTLIVPNFEFSRTTMVKIALLLALSKGYVKAHQKLICVFGSIKQRTLDSILVVDLDKELEIFSSHNIELLGNISRPEVFETVLSIALELAHQGREGKPVGTIFVLGDHEKVLQFSRQMIINPFSGLPEEERNVLDPKLKESIKEFAAIDGAFVIRDDGVILCAGRHLDAAGGDLYLPKGWGSRHMAAAGITNVTNSIAIVVSESTGAVRIFSRGRPFMEIEKRS